MKPLSSRSLPPGVFVATLTFFNEEEGLDLATLEEHISRLAGAGVSGIVTLGSNGEAAHLSPEERQLVIQTTRETLDKRGYDEMPIIVGASAQSTRETIKLCHEAAEAGGSHVLVLPPCYFKDAMTEEVLKKFYLDVADASPLPIIVYSFPAVVANISLTSDLIIAVSKHPNVVGTKFTCGDTGKLSRVVAAMAQFASTQSAPKYWAVGGLADFILPALVAGASGVIAGGGNLAPKACVKVYELFKNGSIEEAMKLQSVLSQCDWPHTKLGIGATKAVLQHNFSYGGRPRRPLLSPSAGDMDNLMEETEVLMKLEELI